MTYALITGASKGIGKAIAIELAKKKTNLLLVSRSAAQLQETANEIKDAYGVEINFLATDLSLNNAASTVYDWCQQNGYSINILINNAGYGLSGAFENYTAEDDANMVQLNVLAPVQLCRIFLPSLKQQPKAYILNIASSAAYQAVPYLSLYSATKAAVLSFTRGLASELKNTSVSVTCICPGATDTAFTERAQMGTKALQAAQKVNMTPQTVAATAVNAMFAGKKEVIVGIINKLGAFFAWLLPKQIVESTAAKIYQ